MKSRKIKNLAISLALIFVGTIILYSCKKNKDWGQDYDIMWPVPSIQKLSKYKESIGNDITINGSFYKVTSVSVGGVEFAIKTDTKTAVQTSIVVTVPRQIGVSGGMLKVTNVYGKFALDTLSFMPIFPVTKINTVPAQFYIDGSIKLEGTNMDLITSAKIGDSTLYFDGTSSQTSLEIKTKGKINPLKDGDKITISSITAKGGIDANSVDYANTPLLAQILKERVGSKSLMLTDFETDATDHYQRWDGSPVWGGGNTETHRISTSAYMAPHVYGGSKFGTVIIDPVKAPLDYLGEFYLTDASGVYDLSTFRQPYLTFLCNTGTGKAELWLEINESGKFGHGMTVDTKGKWQWISVPVGPGTSWGWAEKPHDIDYTKIAYVKLGMKTAGAGVGNRFEVNFDNVQITDGKMVNATDPTMVPVLVMKDFEDGKTSYSDGYKPAGGWQENGQGVPTIVAGTSPDGSAHYLEVAVHVYKAGWSWIGDIYLDAQNTAFKTNETPYLTFWVNTFGKTCQFECEMGLPDGTKWGTNYKITTNGWEMFTLDIHQAGWGKWKATPDLSAIKYMKIGVNIDKMAEGSDYKIAFDKIMLTSGPTSVK